MIYTVAIQKVDQGAKPSSSSGSQPTTINRVVGENDFIKLQQPKKQANILVYGDTKTWKTSFCTRYAPDPAALINFDNRADHAVYDALQDGREIHFLKIDPLVVHIKEDPQEVKAKALALVEKVEYNFEYAVEESKKGNIRTICMDTGTEYSEICRLSFDGFLTQTKEGAFGKDKDYVNGRWWKLFRLARSGQAHFIITARSKEIWIKNEKGQQEATGRHIYRCPPVVAEGVDFTCQVRLKSGPTGRPRPEFELEIINGVNPKELCKVYDEKDWQDYGGPFSFCCWKQFEKTSGIEDWL